MPLYEYLCKDCGKKFMFLAMKFGEDGEAACTSCGSRNKEKIISKVAIWRRGSSEDGDLGGDEDFQDDAGDDDFGGDTGDDDGPDDDFGPDDGSDGGFDDGPDDDSQAG